MGHLYALRGAYVHHVRLMLRKGAYWWFPFAYLPSVLVLSWIAAAATTPRLPVAFARAIIRPVEPNVYPPSSRQGGHR